MRMSRILLHGLLLGASTCGFAAGETPAAPALTDGAIVLLRHANAPGVGDPTNFKLGDCATQRNLDDAGRQQARRIGERLRARGVRVGAVWTSQWCRTRETAQLAFPTTPIQEQPAFNSFFGEDEPARQSRTRAAKALLAGWQGPGVLVVTTHQVNISALTGSPSASGEGVVVRMRGGEPQVQGRFEAQP